MKTTDTQLTEFLDETLATIPQIKNPYNRVFGTKGLSVRQGIILMRAIGYYSKLLNERQMNQLFLMWQGGYGKEIIVKYCRYLAKKMGVTLDKNLEGSVNIGWLRD